MTLPENDRLREALRELVVSIDKNVEWPDKYLMRDELSTARSLTASPPPEQAAEQQEWRVGAKVPINVYEGDRPVCQCQTADDARRIVAAMNVSQTGEPPVPATEAMLESDNDILAWYEGLERATVNTDKPELGIVTHVRNLLARTKTDTLEEAITYLERRGFHRSPNELRSLAPATPSLPASEPPIEQEHDVEKLRREIWRLHALASAKAETVTTPPVTEVMPCGHPKACLNLGCSPTVPDRCEWCWSLARARAEGLEEAITYLERRGFHRSPNELRSLASTPTEK